MAQAVLQQPVMAAEVSIPCDTKNVSKVSLSLLDLLAQAIPTAVVSEVQATSGAMTVGSDSSELPTAVAVAVNDHGSGAGFGGSGAGGSGAGGQFDSGFGAGASGSSSSDDGGSSSSSTAVQQPENKRLHI